MGINLFGFIRGENGLGQSCRLVARGIQAARLPFAICPITQPILENNETTWDGYIDREAPFGINVIHVNPEEMPTKITRRHKALLDNRYNIGFWLWEMEVFPDDWLDRLSWLDEVWVPSEFISQGIRSKTTLPVHSIPYGIEVPIDPTFDRKYFGLPEDAFLFLAMGDGRSVTDRKNPLGAIEAYCKAFTPSDRSVGLVLKLTHMDADVLRKAHAHLDGYPNVVWVDKMLPKEALNSLIACMDVFVSLHRSEGFGLVIAEAMLLGKPVVATNWSANIEFMDESTACMVEYRIITLQQDIPPYAKGDRWADPDVAHAARHMRRLHDDPLFYADLAERAQKHASEQFSPLRMADVLRTRVERIYAEHMPTITQK